MSCRIIFSCEMCTQYLIQIFDICNLALISMVKRVWYGLFYISQFCKCVTVKDFKMAIGKNLMRVYCNGIDKDIWLFL